MFFVLTQAFWWYGYNASRDVDDHPPAVCFGSASLEGKAWGEVSGEWRGGELDMYIIIHDNVR